MAAEVIENTEKKILEIELLSLEDRKCILYDFNNTGTDYPNDRTIPSLFKEQAEKTPHHIAVVFEDEALAYKALDERAAKLAAYLCSKGLKAEEAVGIIAEHSLEMITAIIAVLKAGGTYLPINIDYPDARKRYMLKNAGATILLTNCKNAVDVDGIKEIIKLDDPALCNREEGFERMQQFNHLAYIIYTSGSTGVPKGVMVEHKNVVRLVKNTNYIRFRKEDRILQTGALEFDASTFEIWGALLNGLGLYLVAKEKLLTPLWLRETLKRYCISTLWMTSPFFNQMVKADIGIFSGLANLLVGGDVLSPPHINRLRAAYPGLNVTNGYGPTENTTFSTTFLIDKEYHENIPIGRPIANSTVYIFDRYNHLQPVNVPGELCVGGDGVSRGYLNDPELQSEKFTPYPFNEDEMIYRTGDLARWLPDGNIEFLGRIDHQVKVRGYRIELGEIENHLLKNSEIKEAIVMVRETKGEGKYLCAYIVSDEQIDISSLRGRLSTQLPDYMIPFYFTEIEKIPLTPNGKIDRKALPEPEVKSGEGYIGPRDGVERHLVEIWAEVLGIEKDLIGIDNNFFELGGHSLKATVMVSKIHKEFNVIIPLAEIFKIPMLRKVAEYIKEAKEEIYASIDAAEEQDYYSLSSAQKRIYVLQRMDEHGKGTGYNIPAVLMVEGDVDKERLEDTFRQVIRRHESLRTSFEMIEEEPVQRIRHDTEVEFEIKFHQVEVEEKNPCRGESVDSPIEEETVIQDFIRPFDLSQAPLMRVGLIQIEEEKHILMVDMHHIISDGISMGIFVKEFMALYAGKKLPALKLQYKDYSEWQNREKEKEAIKQQEEYWLKEFGGEIPVLNLPIDYVRPALQSFAGSALSFEIGSEATRGLKKYILEEETTLYMVLLSVYNIFLSKISNQEVIVVGTPTAGRRHADLEQIIGMFVNTLALKNYPVGEKSFREFLREVKERTLEAFANQDYQYENLVESVPVNRDTSRNPLFDTMFALQNMEISEVEITKLKLKPYDRENILRISKFDMTLHAAETEENLYLTFEYCTKLFKETTIERFIRYFKNLISSVLQDIKRNLSDIEIISEEEKMQLLFDFNNTRANYPKEKTIHELFEEQVLKSPGRTALIYKNEETKLIESLNYKQLNKNANQLARQLRTKGIKPDTITGIMVQPSLEMIIGIIAVLKAGGAYLPLEPKHPGERIAYMLNDSNAKLLLTHEHLADKVMFNGEFIDISDHRLYEGDSRNLEKSSSPVDTLYTIYTSGTSGKSKGTLIENGNLVNYLSWFVNEINLTGKDKTVLTSSFGFDLGYTLIYSSLLTGCQLHIIPEETYLSPGDLISYISENEISYLKMTPSLFTTIVENPDFSKEMCCTLRLVILGGEEIRLKDVEKAFRLGGQIEIMNHYGPTEATIGCIAQFIDFNEFEDYMEKPTIGSPIDNMKVFILDRWLNLMPIGVPGELCVSGLGVMRGYLNHPELTLEKFVKHPYIAGDRMYRTGDMARWLHGGVVEFLGRIDNQVKIRGFRIELGEIENRLFAHEKVKEAVVINREHASGDKYLCAYIVSDHVEDTGEELILSKLKEYLSEILPDYMIPSYFVMLEKIPLTPNGKLNKKLLPEPKASAMTTDYTAPRDGVEKKLVRLWQDVLAVEKIGLDDNFFHLGGHSLKAVMLVSKIHKALSLRVALTEIFKTPTVRGLSIHIKQHIKSGVEDKEIAIQMAEKKEYYALSSAQKRLFVSQQLDESGTSYNMPRISELIGGIDRNRLEDTFKKLIARHESLRTSFELSGQQPVQKIHEVDDMEFEIEYFDFSKVEAKEVGERGHHSVSPAGDQGPGSRDGGGALSIKVSSPLEVEKIIQDFIKPFHLSQAPLLRVGLIKIEDQEHILMMDTHHIISDGVSHGILTRDFMALYGGGELPPLRIHYKDFTEWQNQLIESGAIKTQEEYLLNRFKGDIPVLNIPTDYPKTLDKIFEGESIRFKIGRELTDNIKRFVSETGTTLFMLLLAALNILLSKYTEQEDIVVGSTIIGRRHTDLQNIIGMFVNMLPMRNFPRNNKKFREFLEDVKENSINAYENQDYQFDELVAKLGLKREQSRNPLFNVVFGLRNIEIEFEDIPEIETPELKLKADENDHHNIAKFDLFLGGVETGDGINFEFQYRRRWFKKKTIERMSRHFINIIEEGIRNPEIKLLEIQMLSEEERSRLIKKIKISKDQPFADAGEVALEQTGSESLEVNFDF
ncbi:MAG: amino acid adenylation domain-containing protein [Candidatus Aminicenantes bacterium]|nr:MAG: amino acid adenylation domain-containing protein [Candidatus Aminicenantes bacterium]